MRNKQARVESLHSATEEGANDANEVDEEKFAELVVRKLAAHALPLLAKKLDRPQPQPHSGVPAHAPNGTPSRPNAAGSSGRHQVKIEEVESSSTPSPVERTPPDGKTACFNSNQAAELHLIIEQQAAIQRVCTLHRLRSFLWLT